VYAISGGSPAGRRRRHGGTGAGKGASAGGRFDYTAVGHVTVDVLDGGSRRPGGTAFYSALQASRLGLRTLILTRGAPREIEQLLAPYRAELELEVQPAEQTTTLQTSVSRAGRSQRLLAWAGPIEAASLDTGILHLAPVARETPPRWQGEVQFVGLTPQGLVRDWPREGGEIALTPAAPEAFPARCDAIVISEVERDSCAELLSRASRADTVVAVTAGAQPTTILVPGSAPLQVQTAAAEAPGDDLGAGDVFAAAFFIALREGLPARQAACFAGAAAALRVGAAGTSGIAGRSAIESRATAAGRSPA
jgi:sugar/nucleoside kinase (ribokinase family)